jgi:predicted DNA-binding transcriptional regulator AlpA
MKATPASELPDTLNADQFGALLGISRVTVYKREKRRDWPFSRVPGLGARWAKAHVLAVLAGQQRPATAFRRSA